jgi:asparagine synthase (glutamine-hydrolysing)
MAATMQRAAPTVPGSTPRGAVALGHQRLKIIDLSDKAAQPMVDPELGLSIVFNGCIYNYPELRRELTERRLPLLLHRRHRGRAQGLPPLGRAFVDRLHGMFAFCIVERDTGRGVLGATGSASSRCTTPSARGGCASPRPCRRCSPAATSTPRSTRSRCTTT